MCIRDRLDSTSTLGTTKSGQARGFAGSTADSSDMQNRKDAYAGAVVDTEMEITDKVSSARDSINSIVAGNKQTLLQLKQMEQSKPKKKKCCFIMLEVENSDSLDPYVRKYRDEMLNEYNYKGYYKLAEVVVPLMRKSKLVKWFFYLTFVYPAKSWAYTHYTGKGLGFLFSPLRPLWLNLFEYLGKDHKLRSDNVV